MPKKKVALVLSGGSSLGSYIAGALDELLRGFASDSENWEIDIITGASAGATTAAIVAQGLLYRNGETALHDVWVDKLDIVDLLRSDIPANEPTSLLDGARLQALAEETLRWNNPADRGVRAPFCADTLTVAMTLANTTALPYVSTVQIQAAGRKENFVQYRNSEQETFLLGNNLSPTDPTWERISDVARASAAIPFVFPLVPLDRQSSDKKHYIHKPNFDGEARFWYFDGGTFNNLPIHLAWHYVTESGHSSDDRVVVVVNPWRGDVSAPNVHPPRPGLIQHLFGLLDAMMNESSAIQFQGEGKLLIGEATPEVPPVFTIPGVDAPSVEALGTLALVMPDLKGKRLHGNHLHALGAFLDRSFREYDFRRGAADAQHMIRETLGINYNSTRPEEFYRPDDDPTFPRDIDAYEALDNIQSARQRDLSVRRVFEKALDGRIEALVRRLDAPGPDVLLDPVVSLLAKQYVHGQLPSAWQL